MHNDEANGPVARKAMNLISPLITRDVTAGGRIFFLKNFVRGGTESYGQRNAWRSMCNVWDYQENTSLFIEFRRIQLCELSGQTLFTFRKRTSDQVL